MPAVHDTSAVTLLRSTDTIRARARELLARARAGESTWFVVDDAAMLATASTVASVTRTNYPDLAIPYHSRWRHFEAGGVDRRATLDAALVGHDTAEKARAMVDLTVISVLLDAGAGPSWSFEAPDGGVYARSEGLGVASFHAFVEGMFSSDPSDPLRADATGLRAVTVDDLARAFAVTETNPLVGLAGRVDLLHRLGDVVASTQSPACDRPGMIYDAVIDSADERGRVTAHRILDEVLESFTPIWPSRGEIDGIPLGDCWFHASVDGPGPTAGWMPFHKLSQWLTYSLLEPFEWSGVTVDGLDALTGLPEYRNGGLLLDTGVLTLRDPSWVEEVWPADSELIVEWRALTVALLDEMAPLVRTELGVDDAALPLACILEGGTWAAGRVLAQQFRGGLPPLELDSDGTVF